MLTLEQAQEYLVSVGVNLPEFLLSAIVDQVNTIELCLSDNYPDSTALLIQLYLLGLMGLSQGDRYVSSQTAPSGASQSFRYQTVGHRYNGLLGLLRGLDTHGCATGLIPPNPEGTKAHAALWVTGSKRCR